MLSGRPEVTLRISVLTLSGSRYALKLLNLLAWRGIPVEQVVTFTDIWSMRLRWARRSARSVGWGGAARYVAQRWWHSPFRGQGSRWRGRPLECDWRRLVKHHDHAPTPRSVQTVDVLRRTAPDLCLLVGAPMIPASVLAVPRLGTLNAHPGILPGYRGLDPELWALHEERFDQVGCTLHLVDQGVDTGPVLELRPYSWCGDETLERLIVRLTEACLDLLADACEKAGPSYLAAARPQGFGQNHSVFPPWLRASVVRKLERFRAGGAGCR